MEGAFCKNPSTVDFFYESTLYSKGNANCVGYIQVLKTVPGVNKTKQQQQKQYIGQGNVSEGIYYEQ